MKDLLAAVRTLRRLPADRRAMLVVRSMPCGDIIEDDTRRVHIQRPVECDAWVKDFLAYRVCQLGAGTNGDWWGKGKPA